MVKESPDEYVHLLSGKNFWGDNPLGRSILGTQENIIQFNADQIKNYFRRLYQPDRILISVAGNVDHAHLINRLGPAFESIKPGNGITERVTPQSQSLVNLNYQDLEQVHICLSTPGLSINDPRRYACSLLNTILGGNMSSRLFQQVREKRGLAYTVYSFMMSHVDTGMCGIYLAVDPSKALETTNLVLQELDQLCAKPVSDAELKGAVEYTKGSLLLASESNENQMVRCAQNEIHFKRDIRLQEVIKRVESVTAEEILELSQSLFVRNQMGLTLLGPDKNKNPFEEILYT